MSRVLRAIIMGKPGSGKGTVSEKIKKRFNFEHISPGDIMRLHILNQTELGIKAQKFISAGQLVSDEIIIASVMKVLEKIPDKSCLFDGFPRTMTQTKRLDEVTKIDTVIYLSVPDEIIIDRIKSRWVHMPSGRVYNIGFKDPKVPGKDDITGEDLVQRSDDKPEVVTERLKLYGKVMTPIIQHYEKMGLVKYFGGKCTGEIWPDIEKFLDDMCKGECK